MRSYLKINLTFQMLIMIGLVATCHQFMSPNLQAGLYALSLTLKEALLFVLPVIIFCCIYTCMLSFKNKALAFMLFIILGVCLSNFIAVWLGYGISHFALQNIDFINPDTVLKAQPLAPLWQFTLPKWLANEHALLLGLGLGAFFSRFPHPMADRLSVQAKSIVNLILNKLFVPILPIFALGFITKMAAEGVLGDIVHRYLGVVALIVTSYVLYLSFLYAIGTGFQLKRWVAAIKQVIPAGIMGFSSMSSLAAMPINIHAAEVNTQNPVAARAIIPATVNIHLIGDSIFIPVLALALLMTHQMGLPSLNTFLVFSLFFVLGKFAVAGVPGGGIIVMIPILENYLGFSTEMSALITAIYILFDPLITGTNVLGNGAFALLITKLFNRVSV